MTIRARYARATTPPALNFHSFLSLIRRSINAARARSDENEVPDSAEQNHHSYKVPHQARLQKGPKRGRPSLHVMSHEEIETIPDDGGREARANAPHAVVPSKHDDGYVNEGLEEMKEPKLGNN